MRKACSCKNLGFRMAASASCGPQKWIIDESFIQRPGLRFQPSRYHRRHCGRPASFKRGLVSIIVLLPERRRKQNPMTGSRGMPRATRQLHPGGVGGELAVPLAPSLHISGGSLWPGSRGASALLLRRLLCMLLFAFYSYPCSAYRIPYSVFPL